MMSCIDKMGVELEIGVTRDTLQEIEQDERWRVTGDGSIYSNKAGVDCVELVSVPMTPTDTKKALWDLQSKLTEANKSMGFHVHVSLTGGKYGLFCNPHFVDYFNRRVREFVDETTDLKLRRRFDNEYCRLTNDINIGRQLQATGKDSARYKAVNFCAGLHGTIEFRIFPSRKNVRRLVQYILFLEDVIDTYWAASKVNGDQLVTGGKYEDSDEEAPEVTEVI